MAFKRRSGYSRARTFISRPPDLGKDLATTRIPRTMGSNSGEAEVEEPQKDRFGKAQVVEVERMDACLY